MDHEISQHAENGSKRTAMRPDSGESVFDLDTVSYSYLRGTTHERRAIDTISLSVGKGSFVALVGGTGSGKSTLLQLMAALVFPEKGTVRSFGLESSGKKTDLRALRMRAPLSIQRPESALFELYSGDDVAFGPRNQGLSGKSLVERARHAMDSVGLPFDVFRDRITRTLSGGEKRKLALAGVIALEPGAFLLDEPTSSLDPATRHSIMSMILDLRASGASVVMATHSMEEAASADLIGVIAHGSLVALGTPEDIFYGRYDPSWGIGRPFACELAKALARESVELDARPLDMRGLLEAIARHASRKKSGRVA